MRNHWEFRLPVSGAGCEEENLRNRASRTTCCCFQQQSALPEHIGLIDIFHGRELLAA
jgi:hypothetical protein